MKLAIQVYSILSLVLSSLLLDAEAEEPTKQWPSWQGNLTEPQIAHGTYPTSWHYQSGKSENILWRTELPGAGNSSPVIWDNQVFITQYVEAEHSRELRAYDKSNGKLLWKQGVTYQEEEPTHRSNPYCSASPVTDGEVIIVSFASAGVFGYDLQGQLLWKRDLGKQHHDFGSGSSPILYQDLCIVYHGPGSDSLLYALDKKTGETKWTFKEPKAQADASREDGFQGNEDGRVATYATPRLYSYQGKTQLLMPFPEQLMALEPETGKVLWSSGGLNPLTYAGAMISEDIVVASGGFKGPSIAVRLGGKGDITDSHRLWRTTQNPARLSTGIVHRGMVYICDMGGVLDCLELATGKEIYRERLEKGDRKGPVWSNPVQVGNDFYLTNQRGDTFIVEMGTTYKAKAVNLLSEKSNASPAFSEGHIYLRTHEALYAVGEK